MLIINRVKVRWSLVLVHIKWRKRMSIHWCFQLIATLIPPRNLVLLVLLMNLTRSDYEWLESVRFHNVVAAVVHLQDGLEEILKVFIIGALLELQRLNVIIGFAELYRQVAEE